MRIGLNLGDRGTEAAALAAAVAAERCGYDSVWVGEAYGSDAVSPLAYLAAKTERIQLGSAVLQMHARSAAMTAMTAMTLAHLTRGRFGLGLGLSGPQVVEGWHGRPFGKPLGYTREYVEVVQSVIAREAPLDYKGKYLRLPYDAEDGTGLGRSLRSSIRAPEGRIPVYLAAVGPRNIELAGEIADGWLPMFYSPLHEEMLWKPLESGLARREGASEFEVVACPEIALGSDLDTCRDRVRPTLALYIGGMGARGKNYYFDLVCRYGYEAEAIEIQDAFLSGRKGDAAAAVPNKLIDEVALVGRAERIVDRLQIWRESRVTTLCVRAHDVPTVEAFAEVAAT